ncbi:Golgi-associated plant pathogenesis-related protein 1 [Acropora cervicornis]|uniref:Golgi-associated plant pathogenesis-related protein 1 n=1 Tax=Acropora cervicornis TaxID=6130 RepID=A0AAD9VH72_ACRCE|nr:Golgi-associated plant pathogenesis-related protein 1 [Acropora cervicornis]
MAGALTPQKLLRACGPKFAWDGFCGKNHATASPTRMKIVFAILMIILTFIRSCDAAPGKKIQGSAFFKREFLNDKRTECKDALEYCPVFAARGYCEPDHQYGSYRLQPHHRLWNENLAKIAQTRAEELLEIGKLIHDIEELRRLKQGENLYSSTSFTYRTCKEAVESWYSEEKDYDYDNPASSTGVIGHFTQNLEGRAKLIFSNQVVWKGSKQLGVGLAAKRDPETGYVKTYIVARYYPAGNVEGHFTENVVRKVTP